MNGITPGDYLQYGALGFAFFQLLVFWRMLAAQSGNHKDQRMAQEEFQGKIFLSLTDVTEKQYQAALQSAKAMTKIADSHEDMKDALCELKNIVRGCPGNKGGAGGN